MLITTNKGCIYWLRKNEVNNGVGLMPKLNTKKQFIRYKKSCKYMLAK